MLGLVSHELVQDSNESRGQVRAEIGDRDWVSKGPSSEAFHHSLPRERNLAGQQVIHRAAQVEQVTPAVDIARRSLLGRHVSERTDGVAGGGRERRLTVRFHEGAQAEVDDLDLALLAENQVCRLDVAVDDPSVMGMAQAKGGLGHVSGHLRGGERAALPEQLFEVPTGNILHDDIEEIADLIGVESADDVGMIKPAEQPHLPVKPADRARPGGNPRRDDLESDEAAHELVLGLEHTAFVTLPQAIKDNVAADDKAIDLVAQEARDLEFGQDLLRNETLGQGGGIAGVFAPEDPAADILELPVTQDARSPDERKEVGRHPRS